MSNVFGAQDGVVNLGTVGAVPTGPRGVGIKTITYRNSSLRMGLTDGREVVVPMPIGGGMGEGSTGDPTTSIPLTQEVVDYVAGALEPYGVTDEEVKARLTKVEGDLGAVKAVNTSQNARLDTLTATTDAHTKRLDAIAASVQAVIDTGATDAEVAKALADLHIADYLTIADAVKTYAPKAHTHPQADVDGLTAKLADMDSKIAAATGVDMSSYATDAEVDTKIANAVKAYLTQSAADARYAALAHKHAIADITSLQAELDKRFIAPTTGTTGDVLTWDGAKLALKAGGAAVDTSAFLTKTDASNTYLPLSGFTAKGDLLVGTGAKTTRTLAAPSGDARRVMTGSGGDVRWATPFRERFSMTGALGAKASNARCYNDSGTSRSVTQIHAAVGTAPAGSPVSVIVKVDGNSLGTVSIPAGANYATQSVSATWATNSYLSIEVSAVGSSAAGEDLVVTVSGE